MWRRIAVTVPQRPGAHAVCVHAINADPGMLQQALLNLALNACQAMPEGGTITIANHFKAWTDNVLITRLHVALFFGMLPRIPMLLVRSWRA